MKSYANKSYYSFIASAKPNIYILTVFFGVVAAVAYASLFPILFYSFAPQELLLPEINNAQGSSFFDSPNSDIALCFVINCSVIYFSKLIQNTLLAYLDGLATLEMRNRFFNVINNSFIADIEKHGAAKLIASLESDVKVAVTGSLAVPVMLTSVVLAISLLGYLFYLHLEIFIFIITLIVIGIIINLVFSRFGSGFFHKSRNVYDSLQDSIGALFWGAKELKLNPDKNTSLYANEIAVKQEMWNKYNFIGKALSVFASSVSEIILFSAIGFVVFHLSYTYYLDSISQAGIAMVLLYLTGPIVILVNSSQVVVRGRVSFDKMTELFNKLPSENFNKAPVNFSKWDVIALKNVGFFYSGQYECEFKVTDINLTLKRGEITYFIGGNGSGKSTLAKIITMHYFPNCGEIYIGDTKIDQHNIESARKLMSCIFTDYYLFRKLYNFSPSDRQRAERYLQFLGLHEKLKINDNGEFSTLSLSDGQRKRLALLVAIWEDRDIYVFDEWTADQDPCFKKVFYEVILQELKSKNKIIILVTHDDDYYQYADKIVNMDFGKISSIKYKSKLLDHA